MQKTLKIAIEGPDAQQALGEFLAISGIQGRNESPAADGIRRDGGVLAAIAAIVSITAGIASVVEKILLWREKWKQQQQQQKLLNIVLQDARGNRLALDSATPEQIAAALHTLAP